MNTLTWQCHSFPTLWSITYLMAPKLSKSMEYLRGQEGKVTSIYEGQVSHQLVSDLVGIYLASNSCKRLLDGSLKPTLLYSLDIGRYLLDIGRETILTRPSKQAIQGGRARKKPGYKYIILQKTNNLPPKSSQISSLVQYRTKNRRSHHTRARLHPCDFFENFALETVSYFITIQEFKIR